MQVGFVGLASTSVLVGTVCRALTRFSLLGASWAPPTPERELEGRKCLDLRCLRIVYGNVQEVCTQLFRILLPWAVDFYGHDKLTSLLSHVGRHAAITGECRICTNIEDTMSRVLRSDVNE